VNRLDRLTLAVALAVFGTAPAAATLATGRFATAVLGYYVVAGLAAAVATVAWPALARAKRRRRRNGLLADLPPLGISSRQPGDVDRPDRHPELDDVLSVIRQAIENGNRVGFRYRKDDGSNERRIAVPRYVHERRHGGRGAPSICLNAYYGKSGRNENFSVTRMSGVELIDVED
jgi:predicted DNA-binding transcriptional regulator YafY